MNIGEPLRIIEVEPLSISHVRLSTGGFMETATRGRRTPRRMFSILATRALAAGMVVTLMVLTGGLPATAGTLTSTVTDPAGDTFFSQAPGFMDLLSASVSKRGQRFSFQMTVAAPIPAVLPPTPPGSNAVYWLWPLDMDPTTFPAGYPLAKGTPAPAEFIVSVAWDGSSFSGFLIDRRPLLSGGEAVITPLAFEISGTDIRVDVGAGQLGNPTSFAWGAISLYWSSPPGSGGASWVDQLEPAYNPFLS